MARANKIDELGLGSEILELASKGKSSREIVAILAAKGYAISQPSVARYLASVRRERAEATKAIVRDHIRATVPSDLAALDTIIAQEMAWFRDESRKLSERLAVAKELRQTIDTKLKYSGAGEEAAAVVGPLVIVRDRQGD